MRMIEDEKNLQPLHSNSNTTPLPVRTLPQQCVRFRCHFVRLSDSAYASALLTGKDLYKCAAYQRSVASIL